MGGTESMGMRRRGHMVALTGPAWAAASLTAVRLSAVDLGLVGLLAAAERRHADTLLAPNQRERFLAGRIALLLHAAKLAGVPPSKLEADYICPSCGEHGGSDHGRPAYKVPASARSVHVSLSRSGDWCLIAGSTAAGVTGLGIDMEHKAAADFDGFAALALTQAERQLLQRVPPEMRAAFQTALWVRKEAVLKALGTGLAADVSTVDVSGSAPIINGRIDQSQQWVIDRVGPRPVGLPEQFVAALAVTRASQLPPATEIDPAASSVVGAHDGACPTFLPSRGTPQFRLLLDRVSRGRAYSV